MDVVYREGDEKKNNVLCRKPAVVDRDTETVTIAFGGGEARRSVLLGHTCQG